MPRRTRLKERSTVVRNRVPSSAVLLGGIAVVLLLIVVKQSRTSTAPALVTSGKGLNNQIEVPVPVEPIPAGTSIKDVQFRKQLFLADQIPAGAVINLSDVVNTVTTARLPASMPLFRESLSLTALGKNPITEQIAPGMRAMTLKVDATGVVEGWAGSGSTVDILLVTNTKTTVVAEKVKILSAERSVAPVESTASPAVPTTVTILVTQEQCLAINTAIPLGKIVFALRCNQDDEKWITTTYGSDRIKNQGSGFQGVKKSVTGFVRIGSGTDTAYALSDGRWVKSEVIPEGYFPSEAR